MPARVATRFAAVHPSVLDGVWLPKNVFSDGMWALLALCRSFPYAQHCHVSPNT
jgi:hypothetical protein